MSKEIEVKVTYIWRFNHKEWNEAVDFIEALYAIEAKANFDAIDTFHHMNQICRPDWEVKVNEANS